MPPKLANNPVVWGLATDLGLKPKGDPLEAIITFTRQRIRSFMKEISCSTLTDLLAVAAAKVDTLFVEIHTDEDLQIVKKKYTREGELAFANLESQLAPDIYAITFKRQAMQLFDRRFISVIDCRGEKGARCYFSKWHEVAHLLTLTSQQRLKFCRSHVPAEIKDPEETVMDVIAGELGFFDDIVRSHLKSPPSFATIEELRKCLCPEASTQASLIGFVRAWANPCLFIEAGLALRKRDAELKSQGSFAFHEPPAPALRAIRVTPNDAARRSSFFIPWNMRVPEQSVITRVLTDDLPELEARENLSWWTTSDGARLPALPVDVLARRAGHRVQVLIMPIE